MLSQRDRHVWKFPPQNGHNINDFKGIWARAATHCGSSNTLRASLPMQIKAQALTTKPDREFLSAISHCVFQAGFAWHAVDAMWPGFEQAFPGFEPSRLLSLDDEAWNAYKADQHIVHNGPKIQSVRHNAAMVRQIAIEARGFGHFLAAWPVDDVAGLMTFLKQNGSRLGSATGTRFLTAIGKDCFALDEAVIAGLRQPGLSITSQPTSARDLAHIQSDINHWHVESGLAFQQMSLVLSASTGCHTMT